MNQVVHRDFLTPTPRPNGRKLGIGDAVLIQATLCFGYCSVVILGSAAGGAIESVTRNWIDLSSVITNAWLFAMPNQHPQGVTTFDAPLYRHLIAVSTFSPTVFFLALRRHRSQWSVATLAAFRRSCKKGLRVKLARTGYYQMGLGVAATSIILIYGDGLFSKTGEWLFAQPWTFLRAPLLTPLAFSFACYAAAFRWAA